MVGHRPPPNAGTLAVDGLILGGSAVVIARNAAAPGVIGGLAVAWAVARWWWRRTDERGPERLIDASLVAGLAAVALVPHAALQVHLATSVPIASLWLFDAVAVVSALFAAREHGAADFRTRWLSFDTQGAVWQAFDDRRAVWRVAALAGAVWSLRHGGALSPWSCVREAANVVLGHGDAVDLLRGNVGDAQLGNAGLIAGARLRGMPFDTLHGLTGAAVALGGWRLGQLAAQTPVAGWAGLLLLAAHPWPLTAPLADENSFTLAALAATLPVALGPRPPWAWIGTSVGYVFTLRHPLAATVPAFVWLAVRDRGIVGGAVPLLAGALATSALEHAHHVLAFGGLLSFETHAQVPPQTYTLLGREFQARGLMNWPLHETLVRTPHNPYPMWLQWPLHALASSGVMAAALAVPGWLRLLRERRTVAVFVAAFALPVAAGLGIQEGWDHPNKMGVGTMLLPAFAVLGAAGAAALANRNRHWLRVWVGAALALWAIGHAAKWLPRVPADPRYAIARRQSVAEWPAWLDAEAERLQPGLLPAWSWIARHGPPFAHLWHEAPPVPVAWGWFADELQTPSAPAVWRVEPGAVLVRSPGLGVETTMGADVDLSPPGMHTTSWRPLLDADRPPVRAFGIGSPRLSVLRLEHGDLARSVRDDRRVYAERCREFDNFLRRTSQAACATVTAWPPAATRTVATPSSRLSLVVSLNDGANLHLLWRLERTGTEIDVRGPYVFWHN